MRECAGLEHFPRWSEGDLGGFFVSMKGAFRIAFLLALWAGMLVFAPERAVAAPSAPSASVTASPVAPPSPKDGASTSMSSSAVTNVLADGEVMVETLRESLWNGRHFDPNEPCWHPAPQAAGVDATPVFSATASSPVSASSPSSAPSPGVAAASPSPSPSPSSATPSSTPEATPPSTPVEQPGLPGSEGEVPRVPGVNNEGPSSEEGLTIKAIEVEGNDEVPSADIIQVVTSRIGEAADKSKIQRDQQNIYELGFFTDVKVRAEPYLNGVKLIYRVYENPKVRSITIEGNKIVPTEKLRGLMETRTGKILNTKTLFADITVINRYYDNELGYLLEPTHVTNLKFTPEGDLKLGITEGVVVKGIKIVGNTAVPTSALRPLVKMRPGQLFNQFTMKDDSERIARYYEHKDFILDNIKPNINKSEGVVTYDVIEAVVEDIRVEGNTRTRSYVIKRLMRTKIGKVLKRTRLQHDIERLQSSGFFETVVPEPEPGSEPGKVVLLIKVKEQKTGLATLGLGYAGGGTGALQPGLTGAVSFSEKNLNGTGRTASISWQRGVDIDSEGISYFDPCINNTMDSIGVSFYHSEFDELRQPVVVAAGVTSNFALYDDARTGGTITVGRYLSDDMRAFLSFKREDIRITQAPDSSFVPIGLGIGTADSVALNLIDDTRDDLFNPHRGTYVNLGLAAAGGPLGGTFAYTKVQFEVRHYIPMRSNTLAFRLWMGEGNGNLPISEIYYLGGVDTLRAFQDNSFIGSKFVLFNAEYRFPIAKLKLLQGALFTDMGDAWGLTTQPFHLYRDVGVGLRIVFPSLGLGVIRIDYAFGDTGSRSTIGLGQTF